MKHRYEWIGDVSVSGISKRRWSGEVNCPWGGHICHRRCSAVSCPVLTALPCPHTSSPERVVHHCGCHLQGQRAIVFNEELRSALPAALWFITLSRTPTAFWSPALLLQYYFVNKYPHSCKWSHNTFCTSPPLTRPWVWLEQSGYARWGQRRRADSVLPSSRVKALPFPNTSWQRFSFHCWIFIVVCLRGAACGLK